MANIIKFIRGAEADIPVLNQGEPAFTTDTKKVYIGDGAENHQLAMLSDTQNKLNWVYPQDYATGTGTAIDPWAGSCIEDAYTACPTGGTIYLRAGYYELASAVTIQKSINIIGEGMGRTFVVTADDHGFVVDTDTDNVTIKDMTIDGDAQSDGEGPPTVYRCCISIGACDYILLENIEAKNAGRYGIDTNTMNYSILRNIYSHDNYRHGIHSGTDISGNNMYNTYQNIYAWNNGVNGFDDRGNDANYPNEDLYNLYDNLQCWDNGEVGIAIFGQRSGVISNSSVSGNGTWGFSLWDIENFNIHDCSANLNEAEGIYLRYAENVNFTNVIMKNNNVSAGWGCGINVRQSNGTRFTSCQSYDDRGTPLQDYAIATEDAVDYISLVNCKLSPNLSGTIYNGASPAAVIQSPDMISELADVTSADADYMMIWDATDGLMKKVDMAEVRGAGGGASQLSDLTDVGVTTPTDKNILVADGDSWESRALTEADISDLGSYLENILEDTTPELGGELDCGAHSVGFTLQTATGDGTTTIDWKLGNYMKFTHGAMAETFTFTAPSNPCGLTLQIKQDGTGGRDCTWPATVKWLGTEPTWTDGGAAKTIIMSMRYDGTNYWAQATSWEA